MAFDNSVTVSGNATRGPEVRFTAGGLAIAKFGVAWNDKKKDGTEVVSFFDVTCFGQLAENVADTVGKGDRVVVFGRLEQSSWEDKAGEKRSKVGIVADDVAPSLKWATAVVTRNDRADGNAATARKALADAEPAYDPDEEPF